VKPGFNCPLMARKLAGGSGELPAAALDAEQGTRLEEGERADMWARSVSDRKRGEERGAGPRVWWAARAGAGPKEEEVGRRRIAGRWAEKGVG
jgi:hypothetical protein